MAELSRSTFLGKCEKVQLESDKCKCHCGGNTFNWNRTLLDVTEHGMFPYRIFFACIKCGAVYLPITEGFKELRKEAEKTFENMKEDIIKQQEAVSEKPKIVDTEGKIINDEDEE